jgi:hypothetical protein
MYFRLKEDDKAELFELILKDLKSKWEQWEVLEDNQ